MKGKTMKAHFVSFLSPGTFVSEETVKPIESWDIDEAVAMSRDITERYNARPYAFRFLTRERGPDDLDSHETERSGLYFLGGVVETVEQVEARNDPSERILLANMKGNDWDRVVVNKNSWSWTQPLQDGDTILDVDLS